MQETDWLAFTYVGTYVVLNKYTSLSTNIRMWEDMIAKFGEDDLKNYIVAIG